MIGARILRRLLGHPKPIAWTHYSELPDVDIDLSDLGEPTGEEVINSAADLNDDHVWDTAHETNYQNQKRQEQENTEK